MYNNIIRFAYLKYVIFAYGRHVLDSLHVFLIDDYDYVCLYAMIQNSYASWDSVCLLNELVVNGKDVSQSIHRRTNGNVSSL
jgi:hypothetical protein